jgi:hypothetical protein
MPNQIRRRSVDFAEVSGAGEDLRAFMNRPPVRLILETHPGIAGQRLAHTAGTALREERFVPIDRGFIRGCEWSVEEDSKEL